MLRKLRSQLSYANVAATLALVLAVGGGSAYAAAKIRASDIGYHAVTALEAQLQRGHRVEGQEQRALGQGPARQLDRDRGCPQRHAQVRGLRHGPAPAGPEGRPGRRRHRAARHALGGRRAHERPGRHGGDRGRGRHVHRHVQPGREQVRDRRHRRDGRRRRRRHRDRRPGRQRRSRSRSARATRPASRRSGRSTSPSSASGARGRAGAGTPAPVRAAPADNRVR